MPRSATALVFTRRPAATAASIPASTRARSPRAGQRAEPIRIERVDRDVDRRQPGRGERRREVGEQVTVGRHHDLVDPGHRARSGATSSTIPLRTVGSPPVSRTLRTPSRANTAHDPLELLEGQHRGARLELDAARRAPRACSRSSGSCSDRSPTPAGSGSGARTRRAADRPGPPPPPSRAGRSRRRAPADERGARSRQEPTRSRGRRYNHP